MPLITLSGFAGANLKEHKRFLPDGVGVMSTNQKPSEEGDFRPWRVPLAIVGPVIPSGRQTIYRLGRDTPSASSFWLSWTGVVHVTRGFDTSDSTERTYYTDGVAPRWTDNILALAGTPYPTSSRLLAVPQPTLTPSVSLNVDGPSGDARQLYYYFTWVNDIGWESAPSPAFLAPAAKPGAILDLTISESVPAGAYGVNRVRWYRQKVAGDTGTAPFFFLREYATGASGMQDDARALGDEAVTETWIVLPNSATWLTYCWNQFASALVGKTVRFCEPNYIYAWPIEHEYTLADTPLAQAAFAQRLLVFTSAGGEEFTGTDPAGMDQKPVKIAPIVSQRSLVAGEFWCAWAAADGLWYYGYDGKLGSGYRNLVEDCMKAEQWLALVPSTMSCQLLQLGDRTLIFVSYNDGTLKGLIVDPLNPNGIYFLDTGYTAGYWDPLLRKLFLLSGSSLVQWDAGASFMTATFKSKVARQQAYSEGEWIELLSSGNVTTKVYTDDGSTDDAVALVQRLSTTLVRGESRLPDGIGGRDWQVEVSTAGSLQGAVLE